MREIRKNKVGREYVWEPGKSPDYSASALEEVRASSSGSKSSDKPTPTRIRAPSSGDGCKTIVAVKLHGQPRMDVCDADLIPIARGVLDTMRAQASIVSDSDQALMDALRREEIACCDESEISVGVELARVLKDELVRQRITPGQWLAMMPRELAAPGSDQRYDTSDTEAVTLWERLTGAVAGALVGARIAGAPGAVAGAVGGAVAPDVAGAARDAGDLTKGLGAAKQMQMWEGWGGADNSNKEGSNNPRDAEKTWNGWGAVGALASLGSKVVDKF